MRGNPRNTRYSGLLKVCVHYFGPDLHKRVAREAAERHESMNTHVIKQLGLVEASLPVALGAVSE